MDDLKKMALHPQEVQKILAGAESKADQIVDHGYHRDTHPHGEESHVNHFNDIVSHSKRFRDAFGRGNEKAGISPKLLIQSGDDINDPHVGDKHNYMVKPYHEGIVEGTDAYMHAPIMGWAEMATQGLYHAGGIGHLNQKVHVTEHEGKPLLVTKWDPKVNHRVAGMPHTGYTLSHKGRNDAMKIAMMDFLTNHNDRHEDNLLHGRPENADNEVDNVLSIDNGRSFQYKVPNRFVDSGMDSDGSMDPDFISPYDDHLYYYAAKSPAFKSMDPNQDIWSEPHIDHGVGWWKKAKNKIVAEFRNHLKAIKHDDVRAHLSRNFDARVKALDTFSRKWEKDPHPGRLMPQGKHASAGIAPIHAFETQDRELFDENHTMITPEVAAPPSPTNNDRAPALDTRERLHAGFKAKGFGTAAANVLASQKAKQLKVAQAAPTATQPSKSVVPAGVKVQKPQKPANMAPQATAKDRGQK